MKQLYQKEKKRVGPWVRKLRKKRTELRNKGKTYVCSRGIIKKDRVQKPLQIGTRDRRVQFISGLVEKREPKTTRKRKLDFTKTREVTYLYYFEINGKRENVCKKCFLSILDETPKFLSEVMKNKNKYVCGITDKDSRGLHSPANKISEEQITKVISHIKSFSSYESHYTRKLNDKKYLPNHLNLKIIIKQKNLYPEKFMKMKTKEQKNILQEELNNHHASADLAYESKRIDKIMAINDQTVKCYTFDLQQCLPTPDLHTSVAFYKRLYWTFNLTITDLGSKTTTCYLWHESIAKRGANEIASCVFKELMNLSDTIELLFYISIHVQAKIKILIIKTLHHKFLIPGHTRMECDADHSIIEKQKKKKVRILFIIHTIDQKKKKRKSCI
ncbi:Uncharacterized protein FWK35_00026668 [Aphis craccivora]|uniref:Uncharacterized protein n=1 Tax=Aphis craccivora TaxID=307492 RepID=A0A6G0VYQ1_APHCR|nr:Uncharacterized protein FWK35_00026668 [Aphis craccivora]